MAIMIRLTTYKIIKLSAIAAFLFLLLLAFRSLILPPLENSACTDAGTNSRSRVGPDPAERIDGGALINSPISPEKALVPRSAGLGPGNTHLFEVVDYRNLTHGYSRASPFLWIGGVPRSGTTLARVMMGTHPAVRCGTETRVVPRMLQMRQNWFQSPNEAHRLREAGLPESIVDQAVASFIIELLTRYERPADLLCCKDPFAFKYSIYLSSLFPNSKFILMVRDGRAVVNSIISRHVTITGYDLSDYGKCLGQWGRTITTMLEQCTQLGIGVRCLPVYYEHLVLEPERELRRILRFLGLPWSDTVLRHQDFVKVDEDDGNPGSSHNSPIADRHIKLSKLERSTDQVVRALYQDSLGAWALANGTLPGRLSPPQGGGLVQPAKASGREVLTKAEAFNLAPVLVKLGYNLAYKGAEARAAPDYTKIQSDLLRQVDALPLA